MNYKKNLEDVLNGKEVDITPVITVTQSGILDAMELTGTSWPTAHKDPEQMATLGASLHELAGLEDAKIPFCLAVEAESMGCTVDLGSGGRTPEVVKSPFDDPREIEIPDNFEESGRIPVICEAVEILHERYDNLPVCVGITGPFTVAGHLIGVEEILKMINLDYYGVEAVVDVAAEAVMAYVKVLNEVKPDLICVADPTSSGDLLSPLDFQQISRPPLEDVEEVMKSQNVLHICGHTANMLKDMPVDVLKLDMVFLKDTAQDDRTKKIMSLIIDLAKSLDVPVIAEGVETVEQVDFLAKMGCDYFQGYYFARPVSLDEYEKKNLSSAS